MFLEFARVAIELSWSLVHWGSGSNATEAAPLHGGGVVVVVAVVVVLKGSFRRGVEKKIRSLASHYPGSACGRPVR